MDEDEGIVTEPGAIRFERLPEGFEGFWISSPAAIVHPVNRDPA